jgi:putative membrane protein
MTNLKRTLATLSAAVAVLGTAACSHNQNPPHVSAYGPGLGSGAGYAAGPSTEPTLGSVGKAPPPTPTAAEMEPYVAPSPYGPAAGSTRGEDANGSPIANPAPVTWGSGPALQNGGAPGVGVGVTNQMAGVPDVSTLSDAQLAAVVQAINQGEIQEAQLALSKSSNADVKRFARDMISAHRDMMSKTTALLQRLQITPNDNAVSNQLKSDTQSEIQDLQTMRGKDFDRNYIDSQVRNHNGALELMDRIAPDVKNAELKAALMSDRPKVEAHLREAERVQASLQHGNANPQPGSSTSP